MQRKKSSAISCAIAAVFSLATMSANAAMSADYNLNHLAIVNPYEFNVAALALKPSATNLNYAIYNKELPVQSPGWTEQELRPNYTGAFELGGRYRICDGKSVSLDWTHLSSSTSSSVTAPSSSFFIGPDFEIGPEALPIRTAHGSAQFNYDVINLSLAQILYADRNTGIQFFGGLSNTYLREQVNATYAGTVPLGPFAGPFSTRQSVTSNFAGLGPRLGIDANYDMDYGFGLMGEAAASALIGSLHSKTNYNSSAVELFAIYGQTHNYQSIQDQTTVQVIPGFDTKLGVNYKRRMGNGMLVKLQAGYEAAVYVNAISQYIPQTLVPGQSLETGGIFVATMSHTLSSYSVQGPFVEAVLNF